MNSQRPWLGEGVDELVAERPEARGHLADRLGREGRVQQAAQARVVVPLQVEQRLRPPVRERPLDAVVRRPGGAALLEPAVLQQRAHLVVAQDREAVVRADVPALLARSEDLVRVDHERGVRDVEVGRVGGDRLTRSRTVPRGRARPARRRLAPARNSGCHWTPSGEPVVVLDPLDHAVGRARRRPQARAELGRPPGGGRC